MRIDELSPAVGANKKPKRVGRGIGSGHGKTCTRGHKGQRARGSVRPGFEGGQTPIQRRLRKLKGISQTAMNIGVFHKKHAVVNVGQLDKLAEGTIVTPELLVAVGIIGEMRNGVRVLGGGEITKALTVQAGHFSASAAEKLRNAGGTVEVI